MAGQFAVTAAHVGPSRSAPARAQIGLGPGAARPRFHSARRGPSFPGRLGGAVATRRRGGASSFRGRGWPRLSAPAVPALFRVRQGRPNPAAGRLLWPGQGAVRAGLSQSLEGGGGGAVGVVEPALQCVNWWQKNRARADARASAAATRSPTNAARAGSAARRSRCCAVKDADWGEAPGPGGVPVTSQRATLPRDLVPVAACPQGYGDASSFALLSAALLSANQCRAKLPRAERGRQAELDKSPTMDACMS